MTSEQHRYWKTSVSEVDAADVFIRGYNLGELIGTVSFASATYLLIRGVLPTPGQARMLDALLCSVLDYSLKKPGTVAARYCVSANPSMVAGVATAMLAVGEYTLAPDEAGRFIAETLREARESQATLQDAAGALVARLQLDRRRVPGFGHPNFRFLDPRAQKLKTIAQREQVWGGNCAWYELVHTTYVQAVNRPELVINDVGMMAAILADMGFSPPEMTGVALLSSIPGVVAHISEELASKVRIRTVPDELVDYAAERRDLEADLIKAGWLQA
jgi:citryl-CoA lyase